MNTSDSTASPDNNNIHTENHTGSTVPCLKNKTDDLNLNSNAHDYFVPVIMVIVLGIIIYATFFDKESSMLAANKMPPDQNTRGGSDQQTEITNVESNVSAPESAHDDIPTATTLSETDASSSVRSKAISADNQAIYSDRQDNDAYPYAPTTPYSMHPYNNEIMQARRKAYEQAVQAQNEHMQTMHAYRAAVLKRIQRNRADLYNRRQELGQEKQQRRADLTDSTYLAQHKP